MLRIFAIAAATALTLPVVAEAGDAAAGEKEFNKCKSCHMIVSSSDETIVKGGKTGPNLYGVIGRQAGTYPDFRYGDSIVEAGEAGLVWDEATFLEYVQDPRAFLRTYLDDNSARSKMSFKLNKGGEDVYAYLVSVTGDAPATN
jgi:cytochrome c